MTRVAVRIPLQVVLMLRFGFPERTGRTHFCHHLARPEPGGVDVGNRVARNPLLFVVRVKDRRTIAGPGVVPLPVQCGRIMDLKEELEQFAEVIFCGSKMISMASA